MRLLTLALGALGFANFAISGVVHSKPTSSVNAYHPGPFLSRWHPAESAPTPTRSLHPAPFLNPIESSPTITTSTPTCSPGYTYLPTTAYTYGSCDSHGCSCVPVSSWPTSSCIQTICSSGSTPYMPIWTETSCSETSTKAGESCTAKVTSGNITCMSTSPSWGGTRSQRWVADFAARTTAKDMGERSQRWIGEFAAVPTVAARAEGGAPFAICTFDLEKGQYVCPEKTVGALPICLFNLSKGQYDCPTPAGAGVMTTLKMLRG